MEHSPQKFSRGKLLKWAGVGDLVGGIGPGWLWLLNRPSHNSEEESAPPWLADSVRAFTPYEATVLQEVTGFIVRTNNQLNGVERISLPVFLGILVGRFGPPDHQGYIFRRMRAESLDNRTDS